LGTASESFRNPDEDSSKEQERKAIASDDRQPTEYLNAAMFRIHRKSSRRAILADSWRNIAITPTTPFLWLALPF
jgi:hypothetical protein